MRIVASWLLGAAILGSLGSPCGGSTLLDWTVVEDGSADPPGDRIDVSVLFEPGDDALTLETRAFVRLQDAGERIAPVEGRDPEQRDAQGHFLLSLTLRRPAGARELKQPVVIPYASLKLPPGRHQLGYEIRGIRAGQTEFVQPTPLATVVVTERTRTELRQSVERSVPRVARNRVMAYVLKDGRLVPQEVELESEQAMKASELRTAKVEIPGEFSRPRPLTTRGRPAVPDAISRGAAVPLEGRAWAPLSEFEPRAKRTLYYATNRTVVDRDVFTAARFGAAASPTLTYGSCLVNIPIENHTRGQLEVPSYWWQNRDPNKYFLIESLDVLTTELWLKQLSADDVLLFVHGYNTNFESAVLREAQLVHDLKFPGKGVVFSWPSAGSLSGYAADQENAAQSIPALVEVLRRLSAPLPLPPPGGQARKIHAIAHSMGNRVFLGAVRQYELEAGVRPPRKIFGHVALAAPDVDAATFAALVPSLIRQSDTATLYYCQTDRALLASRAVHMNQPVGLGPFFADGLDTINCDNASTSLLGHDYYAATHPLLIDLKLTILFNEKPDDRLPPLGQRTLMLGYPHWSFLPPR